MISNSIFNVTDIYRTKLLTGLCIGLTHLEEDKFKANFENTYYSTLLKQFRNKIDLLRFSVLPKCHS